MNQQRGNQHLSMLAAIFCCSFACSNSCQWNAKIIHTKKELTLNSSNSHTSPNIHLSLIKHDHLTPKLFQPRCPKFKKARTMTTKQKKCSKRDLSLERLMFQHYMVISTAMTNQKIYNEQQKKVLK